MEGHRASFPARSDGIDHPLGSRCDPGLLTIRAPAESRQVFRVAAPGIIGLIGLGVWIFAIFDSIATDSALVRNLPKVTWVFLVLLFGPIGALAWLGFGRPTFAGWRPGDTSMRTPRRVVGPEDSDQWTHSRPPMARAEPASGEDPAARERRLQEWEAQLRKREEDLDE